MTDDQFRRLMDEILRLRLQVEEFRLQLARMEAANADRHSHLAAWVGPEPKVPPEDIDMPIDVKKLLGL